MYRGDLEGEQPSWNNMWNNNECQIYVTTDRDNLPIPASRFVDPAKLPSYRNELEKGTLPALLGKFYQFRDFLALVQPQPRETRQYRLFFSTIGTRYIDLRFPLYFRDNSIRPNYVRLR